MQKIYARRTLLCFGLIMLAATVVWTIICMGDPGFDLLKSGPAVLYSLLSAACFGGAWELR